MKIIASVAAAFLLVAGPALAADKWAPPDPPKKVKSTHHDWTGFYVGADTGIAQSNSKWSTGAGSGASNSFSSGSTTFGGHAGYNFQLNNGLTLGGESGLSHSN